MKCTGYSTEMPFSDYLGLPHTHATALKHMLTSPLAYRVKTTEPDQDSDTLRLGRATHTYVLEPDKFGEQYAVWEGGRRYGKTWDAFCNDNSTRTILTKQQASEAKRIRDAVHAHPLAGKLLSEKSARREFTIVWSHPRTGITIKQRVDFLGTALIDLKTCQSVKPALFSTAAARFGYALQMALYADGVAETLGEVPAVKIIAVESKPPHDVVVYNCGGDFLAVGRTQYEGALDLLIKCTKENNWPGIAPDTELELRVPNWAVPDLDFGDEVIE